MSKNLKRNESLLRALLHNNHKLNKCIFSHIEDSGLKAIVEIIYNVWNLPLSKEKKRFFLNNYKQLQKFIRLRDKRRQILVRHYTLFSTLLHILHKYILHILK